MRHVEVIGLMGYTIEDFLNIRSAGVAGFNADGSKVLVSSNLTGTAQLYRTSPAGGELRPVTSFAEPCSGTYLPHRDDVLLQMDAGGNERHQIYLLDDAGDAGGELRTVVYDPDHIHVVGSVSRDGRVVAYRTNRRNGVDFDVVVHDLETGHERVTFDRGGWCDASFFSPDGRILAVQRRTERNMDDDLYLVDLDSGDVLHVTPHDEEATYSGPAWLADGSAFFFATDQDREFRSIARYELASASWSYVLEAHADLACRIDRPGRRLLVARNDEGYSRLELYDPPTLHRTAEVPLPGRGVVTSSAFSRDGRLVAYGFTSPTEPGDVWLYDTVAGDLRRLTQSPNPVDQAEFVEPDLHRFASFDGESVPVFLFAPADRSRAVPVVVHVHGGPESQYRPSFNAVVQYFVHRGYAVAAPNVRGSTGYGKRYHHLDDVRKRLDSVADLAALHTWMATRDELDELRAALMGGSYGGYMVLAGLAFQPDLWAAGVDIVGISSFVTFLENTSKWRRTYREREYGSLEKDREFLVEASPITHIDRMRAPIIIIHGTNDPRVPLSEAQQIHRALGEKGFATELLVYPDEGHGLAKLKNRLDAYPKVADFLDRVLRP